MRTVRTDIVIVGCGVAGLYCALNLPEDKKITVVTKDIARKSDSFLAQGSGTDGEQPAVQAVWMLL